MNKSLTTNALPPIEERKEKAAVIITSNKVQPKRLDVAAEKRRKFTGQVITTHNLEQVQAENAKAAKKGKKEEK